MKIHSKSEFKRSLITRPEEFFELMDVCMDLARKLQRPQEFKKERKAFINVMRKWMDEEDWKEKKDFEL